MPGEDRIASYRRKMNYIVDKLGNIPQNLDDVFMFEALLYRLHTSIDALMDIVAMLVRDSGETVSDDYTNIETLVRIGLIDPTTEEKLKRLNGLRNAIVREHIELDESTIRDGLDEILEDVFSSLEVLEDAVGRVLGEG